MPKADIPRCNVYKCKRKSKLRGVCQGCYQAMWQKVKAGATTWEYLVEHGFALKLTPGRRREGAFSHAFRLHLDKVKSSENEDLKSRFSLFKGESDG